MTSQPALGVDVRPLREDDVDWVCRLHLAAFPTNVIGRFGARMLRAYYRTFLDSPDALALVATRSGVRQAYVVGVLETAAHRRHVLKHHRGALLRAVLISFLLHPLLAAGLLRRRVSLRLRRTTPTAQAAAPRSSRSDAVLSHVAVDPAGRSTGLGTDLTWRFVTAARDAGAPRVCLATLDGEAGASGFYDRLGWTRDRSSRTFDGRTIHLYALDLKEDDA